MTAAGARQLVLVVGVGRSGTSLVTGILGQTGFHIPQPEIKADETNPRGFGEPAWVVAFHRRLMSRLRVTVFDSRPAAFEITARAGSEPATQGQLRDWLAAQLREADALVVKDPRIGWFLPLWLSCSSDLGVPASFITMLRHPAQILASAKRSYGTWQTDASRAASWLNVMLETERATRGTARAFVHYENLLADWAGEVRRAGEVLGLPLLSGLERERFPQVDEFVDPTLHRSRVSWQELAVPAAVRELADEVWRRLLLLAEPGGDTAAVCAKLDAARDSYLTLHAEAEAIAQSAVTAVKPRRPASKQAPKAPPALRVRLARRVPERYRKGLRRAARSLRRAA
jgi:hypothetical protein